MLRRLVLTVAAASALAAPAVANAQLSLYGGASFPESPLDPGYQVGASLRIKWLLGLRADVNYTSLGQEDDGDLGLIGVGAGFQWNIPFPGGLVPYFMLGGAYHRLDYQGDIESEDEWGAVGGLGLRFGPHLFLEARGETFGDRYMVPVVLGWQF